MKAIEFPEQTCVIAEHQDEYENVPACFTDDGQMICCWKLTRRERLRVMLTGKMWWGVLTFGKPLQPMVPWVRSPFEMNGD